MPKRPRPLRRAPPPAGTPSVDSISLIELERFSGASLHQWKTAARRVDTLQRALHFGLEPQRQRAEPHLLDAVRSSTLRDFAAKHWSRIVDYQYSLEPLSTTGSLHGIGGRFNVGSGLSPGVFTPFGSLYCAEDYDTAYLEKFGAPAAAKKGGLIGADLALRKPGSFTQVRLDSF